MWGFGDAVNDHLILVSKLHVGLQHHLQAQDGFFYEKGPTVTLRKILGQDLAHIWVDSSINCLHTIGGQVEGVDSYIYLGVTFTRIDGCFFLTQTTKDRFTRAYAGLTMLEQCHQGQFQEPFIKVWLFDTMDTLMYGAIIWAPSLPMYMWTQIEHPLVMMKIRKKASILHEIMRAKLTAAPK